MENCFHAKKFHLFNHTDFFKILYFQVNLKQGGATVVQDDQIKGALMVSLD